VSVVCNTSPLILLAKIDRLNLLSQLYTEILIPQSVLEEVNVKTGPDTERVQRSAKEHLHLQLISKEMLDLVPDTLGVGERAAIALALSVNADLVILDDQQGRRVALEQGLKITGTIGVLVEARSRGLIHSLRTELDHLIEAGIWINEVFYHRLLSEFDES
jgi:uncharacterized protein